MVYIFYKKAKYLDELGLFAADLFELFLIVVLFDIGHMETVMNDCRVQDAPFKTDLSQIAHQTVRRLLWNWHLLKTDLIAEKLLILINKLKLQTTADIERRIFAVWISFGVSLKTKTAECLDFHIAFLGQIIKHLKLLDEILVGVNEHLWFLHEILSLELSHCAVTLVTAF